MVALQTHTIVQILLRALHQQDLKQRPAGPFLVAAQTNTAVDNIMRKLRATNLNNSTGDLTYEDKQFQNLSKPVTMLCECVIDSLLP